MSAPPRVVSLLPSATEMLFALGLGGRVRAVSHECDYPAAARKKPKAVRSRFPRDASSRAIDRRVGAALRRKESLYEIDLDVLRKAAPEVVVTQELCDVCAITGTDLQKALRRTGLSPRILTQTPRGLAGVFSDIQDLGKELGASARAKRLVSGLKRRLERLRRRSSGLARPTVCALEWLDPPYACGHWVPELVEAAGGREVLGKPGKDSERTTWKAVAEADPDVIVLMPCGFDLKRARLEAKKLVKNPAWKSLRAVREGRVLAVDANAYFSRPGPRLVEGAEVLARLLHPDKA